jgi:hypothetical protein
MVMCFIGVDEFLFSFFCCCFLVFFFPKIRREREKTIVIDMPSYRQHDQWYAARSRVSSSSLSVSSVPVQEETSSTRSTVSITCCTFASNVVCRIVYSSVMIIGLLIFVLSIDHQSNPKEGPVLAGILLIMAILTLLRACRTLRRYKTIIRTRRESIQVDNKNKLDCTSLCVSIDK